MSLITKQHLKLVLQSIKKLLSFKIDRSEVREINAIEVLAETDIVQPVADENNTVFLDENNAIYTL